MVKLQDPKFNRFRLIHPCDGQTDGFAIAYSALSMLSRANNNTFVSGELQLPLPVAPARTRFKGADHDDDGGGADDDVEGGNEAPDGGCADGVGGEEEDNTEDNSDDDQSFSSDRNSSDSRLSSSSAKGPFVYSYIS